MIVVFFFLLSLKFFSKKIATIPTIDITIIKYCHRSIAIVIVIIKAIIAANFFICNIFISVF